MCNWSDWTKWGRGCLSRIKTLLDEKLVDVDGLIETMQLVNGRNDDIRHILLRNLTVNGEDVHLMGDLVDVVSNGSQLTLSFLDKNVVLCRDLYLLLRTGIIQVE